MELEPQIDLGITGAGDIDAILLLVIMSVLRCMWLWDNVLDSIQSFLSSKALKEQTILVTLETDLNAAADDMNFLVGLNGFSLNRR